MYVINILDELTGKKRLENRLVNWEGEGICRPVSLYADKVAICFIKTLGIVNAYV